MEEKRSVAGDNKFQILLFKLGVHKKSGHNESFGLNIFKIREIAPMPTVTAVAGSADHVLGVVNLRGEIIHVIDLPALVGCTPQSGLNIMLVTEFARKTQAFAVESVEEIVQLEWSQVLAAEDNAAGGLVSGIARLDGNVDHSRLVQVLDVETITRKVANEEVQELPPCSATVSLEKDQIILVADDSTVARALMEKSLNALALPHLMVKTGAEAWEKLESIANEAEVAGKDVTSRVALVLTDLEMPVMDGFTLTRNIKQSARFQKLPVLIHSSLSGSANESRVAEVGADGYVAKFVPAELAAAIVKALGKAR